MTQANWREKYAEEVRKSAAYYNWLNQKLPVTTRQMTDEEYEECFGEKRVSCHRLKGEKVLTNESTMRVLIDDINKVKRFVNIAISLPFLIDIVSGRYRIDAKSIMGVLSLDISKPVELKFKSEYGDRVRFAFCEYEVMTSD